MLPGGHRVHWLAAGTFDRAVGFSLFTLQITHKIDENTDVERDHIVASVRAAEPKARMLVIRDFSSGYHSRNGGGDSVHTDGNLPVLDVSAVKPSPDAPDLSPAPPSGIPLQVWLPALVSVLVSPFVVWTTVRSLPEADTDRALAVAAIVGSVVVAVMALAMFARSALARRVLLAVAAVVAMSHISSLTLAGPSDPVGGHVLGAMVAILMLVALSSPKATEWTSDQRDLAESPTRRVAA